MKKDHPRYKKTFLCTDLNANFEYFNFIRYQHLKSEKISQIKSFSKTFLSEISTSNRPKSYQKNKKKHKNNIFRPQKYICIFMNITTPKIMILLKLKIKLKIR